MDNFLLQHKQIKRKPRTRIKIKTCLGSVIPCIFLFCFSGREYAVPLRVSLHAVQAPGLRNHIYLVYISEYSCPGPREQWNREIGWKKCAIQRINSRGPTARSPCAYFAQNKAKRSRKRIDFKSCFFCLSFRSFFSLILLLLLIHS